MVTNPQVSVVGRFDRFVIPPVDGVVFQQVLDTVSQVAQGLGEAANHTAETVSGIVAQLQQRTFAFLQIGGGFAHLRNQRDLQRSGFFQPLFR